MLKIGDTVRIKSLNKFVNNKLAIVLNNGNVLGFTKYYLVTLKYENSENYYNLIEENLIKVKSFKHKLK